MAVARKQFGIANAAYNGTATFTSLAVSLPAAATAGSVLVAAWSVDKAGGTFTVPSGWTSLLSRSGASVSLYVVYKIAAGGETSVTGTWASAMFGAGAIVAEYTGANTTTPFGPNDLSTYSDTATTSKAFTPATPTSNGDALVIMGIDTVSTSTGFNIASTGYTLVSSSTFSVGSGSPGLALSEKATTSGTANSPTFTWTDSDQVNGVLLQLNVAASNLASDTFTGTSGAAWASQWTKATGTNGTATIASTGTSGQIVLATAHPADAREDLTTVTVPQVCDIYVDVQAVSTGSFVTVSWGDLSGSDARSGNGFETVLQFNGSTSKISIGQFIAGVETKPATDVTLTTASSTWYTLHLKFDGTNLSANFYAQGAAEPGTWTITGVLPTPSSLPTTGKVSLGAFQSNTTSRTTGYDNLVVTAGTTTVISGQTATLSGSGALASTGTPSAKPAVALSGTGGLAATSLVAANGSVPLSGAGGLSTDTPVPALAAQGSLSGSGALTSGATTLATGAAALSGSGGLSSVGTAATNGTAALSGAGVLGTVISPAVSAGVALSGAGLLGTLDAPAVNTGVALSGSGSLATTATGPTLAALSGSGSLAFMPTTFTETWTGTDGSAWPGQWTQTAISGPAGASATIQGNAGQINAGTVSFGGLRESLAAVSTSDVSALVTLTVPTQTFSWQMIGINSDGTIASDGSGFAKNGYFLQINVSTGPTNGIYSLFKYLNDVGTQIVSGLGGQSVVAGTPYNIRLVRSGRVIQFKVWAASGGEPGTWTGTYTDSGTQPSGSGFFLATTNTGSATTSQVGLWDNLSISGSAIGPGMLVAPALTGSGSLLAAPTIGTSGTAALSGSGQLSDSVTPSVAVTVPLAGAGTLAAVGQNTSATAGLSGSGSLSAGVIPGVSQPATLTGLGALSLAATPKPSVTVTLSGSGSLSETALPNTTGNGALTGLGALTVGVTAGAAALATLSGSGALTATVAPGVAVLAALSGSGTLAPTVAAASGGPVTLSGSGSITTGTGAPAVSTTVALSGSGVLAAQATAVVTTTVPLSGMGSLAASGASNGGVAAPALTGTGTLSASSTVAVGKAPALSGTGALTLGTASLAVSVTVALSGAGVLVGGAKPGFPAAAALSGSGLLAATVTANPAGAPTLSGFGALVASLAPAPTVTVPLTGSGALSLGSALTSSGVASLTGSGLLAVTPVVGAKSNTALTGFGALSVSGIFGFTALAQFSGSGQVATVVTVVTDINPMFGDLTGSGIFGTLSGDPLVGSISGNPSVTTVTANPLSFATASPSPITAGASI